MWSLERLRLKIFEGAKAAMKERQDKHVRFFRESEEMKLSKMHLAFVYRMNYPAADQLLILFSSNVCWISEQLSPQHVVESKQKFDLTNISGRFRAYLQVKIGVFGHLNRVLLQVY